MSARSGKLRARHLAGLAVLAITKGDEGVFFLRNNHQPVVYQFLIFGVVGVSGFLLTREISVNYLVFDDSGNV